jgi:hypothetical protein
MKGNQKMEDPNLNQPQNEMEQAAPDSVQVFDAPAEESLLVTKKRAGLWIGLGAGLLVLVIAAAFLGGRLINQKVGGSSNQVVLNAGNGNAVISNGPGDAGPALSAGSAGGTVRMKPAEELPETAPEVTGVMSSLEDNRLFLRSMSGGGMVTVAQGADGKMEFNADTDGPEIEVVVTKETLVYRDVTQPPAIDASGAADEQEIEQKLEKITIDQVSDQGMLSIWGRREGDRVIADIILYMGA